MVDEGYIDTPELTTRVAPPLPVLLSSARAIYGARSYHFFTIAHQGNESSLIYKDQPYMVINTLVHYDEKASYILPGTWANSEHLFLRQDDPLLMRIADYYVSELHQSNAQEPIATALALAEKAIKSLFCKNVSSADMDQHIHALYNNPHQDKCAFHSDPTNRESHKPVLDLSYWISKELGECRHKSMLAFYLLGEALAKKCIPSGKIHYIQSNMRRIQDGHAVVGYRLEASNDFILIDLTEGMNVWVLTSQEGIQRALAYFGFNKGNAMHHQNAIDYIFDILVRYQVHFDVTFIWNLAQEQGLLAFFKNEPLIEKNYVEWFMACLQKSTPDPLLLQCIQSFLTTHYPIAIQPSSGFLGLSVSSQFISPPQQTFSQSDSEMNIVKSFQA